MASHDIAKMKLTKAMVLATISVAVTVEDPAPSIVCFLAISA